MLCCMLETVHDIESVQNMHTYYGVLKEVVFIVTLLRTLNDF